MDEAQKRFRRIRDLTGERFLQRQEARRAEIVEYHRSRSEWYRRKLGGRLPNRWEEIPPLRKADLIPLKPAMTPGFEPKELYTGKTSGSSGVPLRFAKDRMSHAMTWALILDRYRWYGLEYGKHLQARFFGIPLEGWGRHLERIKDRIAHRRRFVVYDLSSEALDRFAESFARHPFRYAYGYTNSLVRMGRHMKARGQVLKDVCPSLEFVITTSEVLTPSDRQLLREGFGVPVINEYGACELEMIAFEHPDGTWRMSDENLYLEVVDDEGRPVPDGTSGRLLLTSLTNRVVPFIRYEVGDLAVIHRELATGRTRLLELQGRLNDEAVLPSGKVVPGLTLYYTTKVIMETIDGFQEYQIRQTRPDRFELDIVMNHDPNERERGEMEGAMRQYLEPGIQVKVNRVARIDRTGAGKFKHFVAEVAT